jgi:hypothetical protein
LHYKGKVKFLGKWDLNGEIGFRKIEGLEKYCNLKSIWLECNGITMIENLGHLTRLRML